MSGTFNVHTSAFPELVLSERGRVPVLEVLLPAEPALEVAIHLRRDVRTERMVMG